VFRAVETPSYERMLADQVTQARAQRGEGDLAALLNSGDTWTVE
jgi:2-oxoglutarate ferredoxin oxidoreductase subunit beta